MAVTAARARRGLGPPRPPGGVSDGAPWLGSGLPHAVRRGSASGGVGVVVDVGLPQVLCLGVDVGLVIVFQSWVIVLMGMSGRHMLPLAAVPEVVHYVSVLVVVNDGVVGVLHGLPRDIAVRAGTCS